MKKPCKRRRSRGGPYGPGGVCLVGALLLAACGDDRVWPDVRGTYDGTWTLVGDNRDTGVRDSVGCVGAVSIDEQEGSRFSGVFTIVSAGYCAGRDDLVGRVEDGRLLDELAIRFELESDEGGRIWQALTDCERGSRSNRMEGRVLGDSLTATVSGVIGCEELGTIDVSLRVDGRRDAAARGAADSMPSGRVGSAEDSVPSR